MRAQIDSIIRQIEDVHHKKVWMGPNFDKKLGQVTDVDAFVRPLPDLHSAAEIISHLTVWRKETILKIRTGKGRLVEDDEENWIPNDALRTIGWEQLKADHADSLSQLIALLRARDDAFLREKYFDPDFKGYYDYEFVIYGMLHHDIYHLGQLGIVIRFLKEKKSS
jgi:hypothetical protein